MTTKENEFSSTGKEQPSFPTEFNGLPVEIDYDGAGRPFPSVIVEDQKFRLGIIKSMIPGGNIIVEHVQTIRNVVARDDDVLICTSPKSGTHWIWEIVSMLRKGKAEYDTKIKETAMLEFLSKDQIEALESPRILNTHFPLCMLPKDLLEKKRKIIHVLRNPKDVAVSMYHHFKSMRIGVGSVYSGTFSDYLPLFLSLEWAAKGGWNKYIRDFEKFAKDNPDYPMLTLYFEDMKQDPIREITKVAKFLDVPYTEELITAVAERCEFENLKKANKEIKDDYITRKLAHDGKQFMYRKGTVGDWKNWFTVAQNELFDETFERWMSGSELKFKFFL